MRIGCIAAELLRETPSGTVIAVFDRSAYLDLGHGIVCLAERGLPEGPLMVPFARPAALRRGDTVTPTCRTASVWRPPMAGDWSKRDLRTGLTAAPSGSPEALSSGASRDLSRWIAHCLPEGPVPVPDALLRLVGLGPGLTPSGDDFLGGAMVAARALNRSDVAAALFSALDLSRTNRISVAHLAAARIGAAAAPLHGLLNDVLRGRTARIPARLTALDSMGHSSGRDAWAGCRAVLSAYCADREKVAA